MKRVKQICTQAKNGFSMITVLVAIAFIGIMAMIILTVTATNLYMRATEARGEKSFYKAEQALDEIRAGLQKDVGSAMSDAYTKVLERYGENDDSSDDGLDVQRQRQFKLSFIQTLEQKLEGTQSGLYNMDKIRGYVDLLDTIGSGSSKEELMIVNVEGTSPQMVTTSEESVVLKNLKIVHIDESGHSSIIETDIRLEAPDATFPTPTNLPDLMNLIIVANSGMEFINGNAGKDSRIQIKGNVYGGSQIKVGDYLDVQVSEGEYFVSNGLIEVSPFAKFSTTSLTSLWAEGITSNAATVKLLGKTYLADDLTINGKKVASSTVTVGGEYYGYGSSDAAEESEFKKQGLKYSNTNAADKSSSILINGKNTTLDLTSLTKMMIAGNSYVNSQKQAGTQNDIFFTGESLNIKGTQVAYLVPASCIGDGVTRNPLTMDEYNKLLQNGEIPIKLDEPISEWGGKTLRELQVDPNKPYSKVVYPTSANDGFVYLYLNFKTEEDATNFFQWYYNESEERREEIQQYLDFYLSDDGIKMNNKDSFLRLITKGNVISKSNTTKKDEVFTSDHKITDDILQEQINYYNVWYALTRKMIPNFDMLSDDEKTPTKEVFQNLIEEDVLADMTNNLAKQTEFITTDEENETIKAVVIDNTSEFVIDEETAKELRLLVCTGNVRIEENVEFQGIIMTKGQLFIEDGVTLSAKPTEAAKLLQTENNDQKLATVFKNGDQYAIGNSKVEAGNADEQDTYELADYITYENWMKK